MYTKNRSQETEGTPMRMTHEADYAIRVMYCLASAGQKLSAKDISEQTGVTLRFSLKILRKLIGDDLVKSFKGVTGGYILNCPANEISLGRIIECIDGPILINHCLSNEFDCSRVSRKGECDFHKVFGLINARLRKELYAATLDQFTEIKPDPKNIENF